MKRYFLVALPSAFVVMFIWLTSEAAWATIVLSLILFAVSAWFVLWENRRFGGITNTSCFIGITAFVFGSRGLYIASTDDFYILDLLGLPRSHGVVVNAMGYVVLGSIAYMAGALAFSGKLAKALIQRKQQENSLVTGMNFTTVFLYAQILLTVVLYPVSQQGYRASLYEQSESAYFYLLPTLIHGFDLYFFVHSLSHWKRHINPISTLSLALCGALILSHAYMMSNMSPFRSYFLAGIFVCSIAALIVLWRRISMWALLTLILIYPLFKVLGVDRDLTNADMVQEVLLKPQKAYSAEGLELAFGAATDLNMLDTFSASLNWEHRYRGYILSYIYPLVHWIPRQWWPSKPTFGVLSDGDYVYVASLGRSIPYSPGIIGFFNDDGGKAYMLMLMFCLGVFMRYWEVLLQRIRGYELYVATTAALLLSSIVTVRYLPYQIFYQFLVIFIPCWLCDLLMSKRRINQQL